MTDFTPPSMLRMPWSSGAECRARQEEAYMAFREQQSVIQQGRNARPANPYSESAIARANQSTEIERRRSSRSL